MDTSKNRVHWPLLVLGLGALSLAILTGSTPTVGAAPQPQTTNVNVVNTPSVNQGGTWTVGVSGTPTVQAPPTLVARGGFSSDVGPWTNNTNQVAVIEYVWCFSSGSPLRFFIGKYDEWNLSEAGYYIPSALNELGTYSGNLLTKLYVAPGEKLIVGPDPYINCQFSGHMEPFGGLFTPN